MPRSTRSLVPSFALLVLGACSATKCDDANESKPSLTRTEPAQVASHALSREQLLDLLLDPTLFALERDEVRARFAALAPSEVEPLPGAFQLVTSSASERLAFHYQSGPDGSARLAHVAAEFPAEDAAQARAHYEQLAALTEKKLGQPLWVKDDPQYPTRGFKLADRFDVVLGAVATAEAGQPYAVLSLSLPPAN